MILMRMYLSFMMINDTHHEKVFLVIYIRSQLRWSTSKNAYAIMAMRDRMNWVLASSAGFDLIAEHHNLVFLFQSLRAVTGPSQTSVRQVSCWACSSTYNYAYVLNEGHGNVWVDLLHSWGSPNTSQTLVSIFYPSLSSSSFCWCAMTHLVFV